LVRVVSKLGVGELSQFFSVFRMPFASTWVDFGLGLRDKVLQASLSLTCKWYLGIRKLRSALSDEELCGMRIP
jgi:hypothetical protein